jgi:2-C-methyl-D-erythritol 4-phosphate cytidylyltransferase
MQEYVIIVAGGTGSRMKSDIPKQFIAINGLPVLMHTILVFKNYSPAISIILVLPENQFSVWKELCIQYQFQVDYTLVAGGETRFHSVKNGLETIILESPALIAVHDGVRPVITAEMIRNGFSQAAEHGTAVASVPLKDSIRIIEHDGKNRSVNRSEFKLIQTPQTFRSDWMIQAFTQSYQSGFTDCASVLEAAGHPIFLFEGSYENIKITTPEDLKWAELYLK